MDGGVGREQDITHMPCFEVGSPLSASSKEVVPLV